MPLLLLHLLPLLLLRVLIQPSGAPEMLATVIEGESLLNDGTSYVLFSLFRQRAEQSQDAGETMSMILRM